MKLQSQHAPRLNLGQFERGLFRGHRASAPPASYLSDGLIASLGRYADVALKHAS